MRRQKRVVVRGMRRRAICEIARKAKRLGPNWREEKARQLALDKGYEVFRGGWPDFLLWNAKEGRAVFLEVKAKNDKLSRGQVRMHAMLKKLGLNVQVYWLD